MIRSTSRRPARLRRAALACALFIVAACSGGSAGGSAAGGDAWDDGETADAEIAPGTLWPGSITRTLVLNRQDGSTRVTVWREERWENFRVAGASSRSTAGFDTDWTLTERIRESTEDCVYIREAQGKANYPWFMFDADPFNELEYRILSAGTGDMDVVTGTMHGRCRYSTPREFTTPYQTAPTWLPGLPFELPAEYRVPGYTPPDAAQYGPVIAGRIDPAYPNLIRGRAHGRLPGEEAVVTLTWNLNRAGECDEQDARAMLRQQQQVIERALQAGTVEANTNPRPAVHLVAMRSASSYSPTGVSAALQAALGQDYITVAPAAGASEQGGLVRFAVRLSGDGRILQSLEAIQRIIETACMPDGSFEGARTIVAGAVQWTGDQYRVTMRKFDVETGTIHDAVGEDGRGGMERLNATLRNMALNVAAGW